MATVRKRGKTYSARWLQADKSYAEKGGFTTHKAAKLYGMEQEVAVKRGRGVLSGNLKMTLAEFIDSHWKQSLVNPNAQTKADYQNTINKHILPYFGSTPMSEIKPIDVKTWQAQLTHEVKYFGKPLSLYTIQKYRNLLASILKEARVNDFIYHSPFEKMQPQKKVKPQRVVTPLEINQVYELVSRLTDSLKLLVWIPFFTGLRPSEVLGLTLDDIDFQKKEIRVRRQLSRDTNKIFEKNLKTSNSKREIPLSPSLETLIKEHVEKFGLGPESLLFKNRVGGVLRYKDAARSFRIAARAIGLAERDGLHVLRHTFASMLIRQGVNIKVIQNLMGHANISETLDTYGHLYPEDKSTAIVSLEALIVESGKLKPNHLNVVKKKFI
jgi:integrase